MDDEEELQLPTALDAFIAFSTLQTYFLRSDIKTDVKQVLTIIEKKKMLSPPYTKNM